jgi:hypothetical protein
MSIAILRREAMPDEQKFHMAWSMPSANGGEEGRPVCQRPRLLSFETPVSTFGLWLCEFTDEETGLSSPPPMN